MDNPSVRSRPYTVPRVVLARLAAELYVRTLGFILVSVPIFGILCLVAPFGDLVRLFGWVCLCWPLTIPMRGYFVTHRVAKTLRVPHIFEMNDERLMLYPAEGAGKGVKLERADVRFTFRRGVWVVVCSRKLRMMAVSTAHLEEDEVALVLAL